MEKLLIHFDEKAYKSELSSIENVIVKVNVLINDFNKLGIGEFEPQKFEKLIFNFEQYFFENFMKDEPLVVNGKQRNMQKVYETFDKPIGYDKLLSDTKKFIANLESRVKSLNNGLSPSQYLRKYISFAKNGKWQIADGIKEEIEEKMCEYVYTDKGAAAFNLATKFASFINVEKPTLKKMLPYSVGKEDLMRTLSSFINFIGDMDADITVSIPVVQMNDK